MSRSRKNVVDNDMTLTKHCTIGTPNQPCSSFSICVACTSRFGQVLSSRADFMPRQYLEHLAILQDDDVPQLPIDKVKDIVQTSL
jgi:hypothetical protein